MSCNNNHAHLFDFVVLHSQHELQFAQLLLIVRLPGGRHLLVVSQELHPEKNSAKFVSGIMIDSCYRAE